LVTELELSSLFESNVETELNASVTTVALTAVNVVVAQSPAVSTAVTRARGSNAYGPLFEGLHDELARSNLTSTAKRAANGVGTRPSVVLAREAANRIDSRTIEASIASSAADIFLSGRKGLGTFSVFVANLGLRPNELHVTHTRVAARSVNNGVISLSARRTTLAFSRSRVRILISLARSALRRALLGGLGVGGANLTLRTALSGGVANRTQRAVVVSVGQALDFDGLDSSIVVTTRQTSVLDELPLHGVDAHAHKVLVFDVLRHARGDRHHGNSVHDEAKTVKSTLSIDLVEESNIARSKQSETQF
jgi:hypothetical protein